MNEFDQLNDLELVALCIEAGGKDERPFIALFQRHTSIVNRILWRYFPSERDVEDLTQEVFFKIYRNLSQFKSNSSFKTWIFSIATNTAKNEIRARNRRLKINDQMDFDPETILSEENEMTRIEDIIQQQIIDQVLDKLSQQEQEILRLKESFDMTYLEIASKLDISESAAKMRVQRARLALRKHYQELLNEE